MNTYLISYDRNNEDWGEYMEGLEREGKAKWMARSTWLLNCSDRTAEDLYDRLWELGNFDDGDELVVSLVAGDTNKDFMCSQDLDGFIIFSQMSGQELHHATTKPTR